MCHSNNNINIQVPCVFDKMICLRGQEFDINGWFGEVWEKRDMIVVLCRNQDKEDK